MKRTWQTELLHSEVDVPPGYRSLAAPVYRGSTTLFDSAAHANDHWDQYSSGYSYGLYGTPTTLELAQRICKLEGGSRTLLTPGGQAAIALVDFAMLKAGDHVLVPASIYGPNKQLTRETLRRFGVESTFYDPLIGNGIASLVRENTRLVWTESPGSVTMEVQDVPAIVEAARAHGIPVVLDNTWAAGIYFRPFDHGVDIALQALTKYEGGHSDVLMGAVTVRDDALWQKLGASHRDLGYGVSPDDCSLVLRGLQTMAVRLAHIERSALEIARWLAARAAVERVLHPALPSCPGHDTWRRDFTGSSGVFSIVFADGTARARIERFVDDLELFDVGYSWAGTHSLAMPYSIVDAQRPQYGGRLVRFNIGLETTADLIADLERALP